MIVSTRQQVIRSDPPADSRFATAPFSVPTESSGAPSWQAWEDAAATGSLYFTALSSYLDAFAGVLQPTAARFIQEELTKGFSQAAGHAFQDYWNLALINFVWGARAFTGAVRQATDYHKRELHRCREAWFNTLSGTGPDIAAYWRDKHQVLDMLAKGLPQAIRDIKDDFGFHWERVGYRLVAQTPRFKLYQVLPNKPDVTVQQNGKPVLLIPSYILGDNILAFLPGDERSYAHAFANRGIPTYVRVVKEIADTPAVQQMSVEQDVVDTAQFCERLKRDHGRPVTVNGYCQGGFVAALGFLSGQLDGLADALITCVSPLDGSRSQSLVEFLNFIPSRFRNLEYGTKKLPNGNLVVNGTTLALVYKLRCIETEGPVPLFYGDLARFDGPKGPPKEISRVAAAINRWLTFEVTDIPLAIAEASLASYTIPVDPDGNLPIRLFGKQLNFRYLAEQGIHLLMCYAAKDDLVGREAALAAVDFVPQAKVTGYPQGHASVAISCPRPNSDYPLDGVLPDGSPGPVYFHLTL